MSQTQKSEEEKLEYTGKKYQFEKGYDEDPNGRIYYPYLPSPDLKEAVNLAIALKRPLLLEGEPGCGKTRLAGAVAYEFTQKQREKFKKNGKDKSDWWWDYYIWNVKSTTRARDGLYRYDAIARLRDAQLMGTNPKNWTEFLGEEKKSGTFVEELKEVYKNFQYKTNYREFGPLGKALQKHDHRPILLIDEIDKADSDFANDLLLELEELRFEIPETGESFPTPELKPIIFITSNREKPLPEAFLRRCLYFFVKFPEEKQLRKIIDRRFEDEGTEDEQLNKEEYKEKIVEKAIERFYDIREHLEKYPGSKQPGTSEFLEFLNVLLNKENPEKALEDLEDLSKKLPLLGTLLKTKQDQESYQNKRSS